MENGFVFIWMFLYVLFRHYLVAVYTYIFFFLESNLKGPKLEIVCWSWSSSRGWSCPFWLSRPGVLLPWPWTPGAGRRSCWGGIPGPRVYQWGILESSVWPWYCRCRLGLAGGFLGSMAAGERGVVEGWCVRGRETVWASVGKGCEGREGWGGGVSSWCVQEWCAGYVPLGLLKWPNRMLRGVTTRGSREGERDNLPPQRSELNWQYNTKQHNVLTIQYCLVFVHSMHIRVQQIWFFLENEEYRPFDGCKTEI